MLRMPRPVCERLGRNSSRKGFPQNDSPPGTERSMAGSEDDQVLAGCSQQGAASSRNLCQVSRGTGPLEGSPGPEDGGKGEGHTLLLTHVGEGVSLHPSSRQAEGGFGRQLEDSQTSGATSLCCRLPEASPGPPGALEPCGGNALPLSSIIWVSWPFRNERTGTCPRSHGTLLAYPCPHLELSALPPSTYPLTVPLWGSRSCPGSPSTSTYLCLCQWGHPPGSARRMKASEKPCSVTPRPCQPFGSCPLSTGRSNSPPARWAPRGLSSWQGRTPSRSHLHKPRVARWGTLGAGSRPGEQSSRVQQQSPPGSVGPCVAGAGPHSSPRSS